VVRDGLDYRSDVEDFHHLEGVSRRRALNKLDLADPENVSDLLLIEALEGERDLFVSHIDGEGGVQTRANPLFTTINLKGTVGNQKYPFDCLP